VVYVCRIIFTVDIRADERMSDIVLLSDDRLSIESACSAVKSPTAGAVSMFIGFLSVILNNASDYRANGLLSDYIGWTNGLTD